MLIVLGDIKYCKKLVLLYFFRIREIELEEERLLAKAWNWRRMWWETFL